MNVLLTATLCLASILTLADCHRYRREETVSEETTDSVICLAKNCAAQYKGFYDLVKGMKPAAGRDLLITREKIDSICREYKTATDCTKNQCTVSSRFQDALNTVGVIDYACARKEAMAEHGQCIYDALKDRTQMEEECEANFLGGYLQAAHSIGQHHRRIRKDAAEDAVKQKLSAGIIRLKESLKELPSLTCGELTLYKTCVVERIKDKCDKDGSTEASELGSNLYDEFFRKAFKGLKAIQPSISAPDVDVCFPETTKLFWFF